MRQLLQFSCCKDLKSRYEPNQAVDLWEENRPLSTYRSLLRMSAGRASSVCRKLSLGGRSVKKIAAVPPFTDNFFLSTSFILVGLSLLKKKTGNFCAGGKEQKQ